MAMQIEYDHKIEISIPRFLDLESKLLIIFSVIC